MHIKICYYDTYDELCLFSDNSAVNGALPDSDGGSGDGVQVTGGMGGGGGGAHYGIIFGPGGQFLIIGLEGFIMVLGLTFNMAMIWVILGG